MNKNPAFILKIVLILIFGVIVLYLFKDRFLITSRLSLPGQKQAQTYPDLSQAKFTVEIDDHPTLGNILIDSKGNTLYTFSRDSAGVSTCSDECARVWSPMIVSEKEELSAPVGVVKDLTKIKWGNDGRMQLAHKGRPLYYYTEDTSPGDVKGQMKDDAWAVVVIENPYTP